jgi:hypothetical protein
VVFSAPLPVGAGGGAFVLPLIPQIANFEEHQSLRKSKISRGSTSRILILGGKMRQFSRGHRSA